MLGQGRTDGAEIGPYRRPHFAAWRVCSLLASWLSRVVSGARHEHIRSGRLPCPVAPGRPCRLAACGHGAVAKVLGRCRQFRRGRRAMGGGDHRSMLGTICIVSPGNLASNPRVLKEADALHEAGYAVTAVVCDYTAALRPFDDAIAASVPWRVVRVLPRRGERPIRLLAGALARLAGGRVPMTVAARAFGGPVGALSQPSGWRPICTSATTSPGWRQQAGRRVVTARCWVLTPRTCTLAKAGRCKWAWRGSSRGPSCRPGAT